MNASLDFIRLHKLRKGSGHRRADAAAPVNVKRDPTLAEPLENTDVSEAKGAPAASDKANGLTRQEPYQAIEILFVFGGHVVHHEDIAEPQPWHGRFGDASPARMQHDESPSGRRKNFESEGLDAVEFIRRAAGNQQQLIRRTQGGLCPVGEASVSDANDEIMIAFNISKPIGDG